MKSTYSLCLILLGFLASSCSENSVLEPIILPSNLSIEIEYLGDGLVKANFIAENAVFYKVSFGTPGESFLRVDANSSTKKFLSKGDFTFQVQAHTTENDFIVGSKEIRVNASALGLGPDAGYSSPISYDDFNLVWTDDFSGTELSSDWNFDLGDGCPTICGWGSEQLQSYKKENTTLVDGNLVITAKKENAGTRNYTSSRINTQGKKIIQYGRVDIRAKLPKGKGFWPIFWMPGINIDEVGWPKSGIIQIMEMIGGDADKGDATLFASAYWDNVGKEERTRLKTSLPFGIFNDEFHVFSIIWDSQKIIWLLDGVEYHSIDITSPVREEFQKPFHFVFNLAVGGREVGSPDDRSVFPQEMRVDYIRIFQKK